MAVRLYAEFRSDRGDQYKIEIHDSQWLAAATEFNVDSRGFELTYEGETDDIVSPIVGSKLSFGAYSTNGTFETFIDTLKGFQENRFRVVVRRISSQDVATDFETRVLADGGTIESLSCVTDAVNELGLDSYQLYWVGWLTQDLVNVEDASQPYIYEITATDGLGRLANIEYDAANVVNETNGFKVSRITDVLNECFDKIGTTDLWGASDVYFETSADWWETNAQTYSTANDPLAAQGFDVRYFREKDDDGNDVLSPALELLRQMATLYNARVYMQRGRFVFEQYGNRDTQSRYVSRYDKTGAHLGRVLISDDVAVDQTLFAARRAGNNWNFLPAAQLAKIHYVQRFLNPFNAFGQYRFRTTNTSYTAGFIAGGSGVQLSIGSTSFNFKVIGAPTTTSPIFPVFKMRIRIQDSSTGTFYYCNRTYNGYAAGGAMFGIPSWSTTPGEYFFDLPMFFSSGIAVVNYPVAIITPDLPVNGELDFVLSFHGVFRAGTGATYTPTQTPLFDSIFVFGIETNGATNAPGATFSSTNNDASVDSNLTIDLGDVVIADGPRQSGHLAAYNGTAWVGTEDWRKGASGTAVPILKLLSNETLALHVRPIEQYNGNVIGAFYLGQRIVFDSDAYLMTGGTFTANTDEWASTWYRIQTIRTAVTALDELPDLVGRTPLQSATTSGVSPNDIIGGRIAGMAIDIENEAVGPYEQTATGGRINGTANITGVATMEKTTIVGLESYIDAFVARVTADGGVVESRSCISDAITTLSDGALVSLIPTDIAAPLTTAEAVTMKKTLDVDGATTMGATLDVSGKTSVQTIQLDTAYVPNGEAAGSLFWDPDAGIPAVGTIDGDRIDIGEKSVWFVKNQTGSTIAKGAAVYASGTLGSSGQILIAPMIADGTINAKYFLGLAQQPIDNGGDGYVVSLGKVRNVDTSAFSAGAVLYVSPTTAGALTATEPAAPNLKLPIAIVVNAAANGTISVRQTAGTYLAESHDVQISSPAENELLARTASGRWENVELGAILTSTTETPATTEGESFTAVFGDNAGTIMGEPSKWLPITIGGVNYLMPLYTAP